MDENKKAAEALTQPVSNLTIPDNYVAHTLQTTKALPPITIYNIHKELNYLFFSVLFINPIAGFIGATRVSLCWQTAVWSVIYYFITGLGITAGYHRLWAHRSYNASTPLAYYLAVTSSGALQGSIKWWARGHRAHHRYTDTDLDPYNAHRGFFWSHIGWMIVIPRRRAGAADISDLSANPVVRWQHKHFVALLLTMTYAFPTLVAGLGWGDWMGGFIYAGIIRLCFVHHSTFCVNSLAHWLGDTPFDDKHTPKDHMFTAFATIGEGYHNFHHQFPMDYRNAIKWYQYDPTKWFISACKVVGLASHLKTFPANEIRKGQLTMQLKKLREDQESVVWPSDNDDLPVIDWENYQKRAEKRPLVLIAGFIHDVEGFLEEHPGGAHLISKFIGQDASTAFFGGVYDHSNAAHNLLAMKRVAILHGGAPHANDDQTLCPNPGMNHSYAHYSSDADMVVPPSQRLRVTRHGELLSSGSASASSSQWSSEDL